MPCTTILVGKKATADGSTIISRNEDFMTAFNPKQFRVVTPDKQPREYQATNSKFHIKLPADPLRYTEVCDASLKADWLSGESGIWGEAGINAANVAMSATETSTTNARVLGIDPLVKDGLGEEDLLTIVLPYVHTAREAVQRTANLLAKYGTYESNGMAFSDQDEVWYFESIGGHHFAAKKVPDDCYVAAPNWFAITDFDFHSNDTMCSDDLQHLVAKFNLNTDRDGVVNLQHIFGTHTDSDYAYNIPRQWYIHKLFNPADNPQPNQLDLPFAEVPEHKLTIEDIKYALSSHYQHTPYDVYGHGTEEQKHTYRPIGIQRNQEVHILQLRNNVPEKLAAIQWLAFGPNAYNGIAPFYANVNDTPAPYRDTTTKFDIRYMYWLTHTLATVGDEHNFRYNAELEDLFRDTPAAGRNVLMKTDAAAAKLEDEALDQQLQAANNEIAKDAHDLAMKCLGGMVTKGALKIKLNF